MSRPLITNPQSIPVVGRDDHLPALEPHRLSADAVEDQLKTALDWSPVLRGDGGTAVQSARMAAAVLVPLVRREGELSVLLTQRTSHLRAHAGQISFPGGRCEEDDPSPQATALREAQEEVGLAPPSVRVLGLMPTYRTVTAFDVTPVVGVVEPPLALQPDAHEVADIFEVPLAFLMNPAHHHRHRFEADGAVRQFLSMPWVGTGWSGQQREFFIWGATAAMLRNLYHLLAR